MVRRIAIMSFIALILITIPLQLIAGDTKGKKEPVHIVSDRLEAYNEEKLVVFIGNVVATQGNMTINADKLHLYYKERTGEVKKGQASDFAGAGGLERLEAKGNVVISQDEKIVKGNDAVFYSDEQKIVVTGNALLQQGENIISGNKVTFFLTEKKGIVESSVKKRVSAIIYPDAEKKQ